MKANHWALAAVLSSASFLFAQGNPATQPAGANINLAVVATPSASFVSGDQTLAAIVSGFNPRNARDRSHGAFGNWPHTSSQWGEWVELDWSKPISTSRVDLYFYNDNQGLRPPREYRFEYWNGSAFVPVANPKGLAIEQGQYNTTTFDEITTPRVRMEFNSLQTMSVGILQWKVYDSGKSPQFPPTVTAGQDRVVVTGAKTYLSGSYKVLGDTRAAVAWSKQSGPGDVTFADSASPATTAAFSVEGEYVLRLSATIHANDVDLSNDGSLKVHVEAPSPVEHLEPVTLEPYKVSSRLWNDRFKALIVNWIPHCFAELSDINLREGGINNFIQAGNKLAGRPFTRHVGYPFANAYVLNTLEAMCSAQAVDAQGDAEITKAQLAMRAEIDEWVPIILAAQEPDGYLQTRFTLDPNNPGHWTPRYRGEHEGYVGGYFLEAAIAHFNMTHGADRRMYDAARRLADCWYANIGPAPKKAWYDGHEEMEQALIRFARLVDQTEGTGKGDRYVALARFLLDCRAAGSVYDQTQSPVVAQYSAEGHAVRAVYVYNAMSGVAMATGDLQYQSAVRSIWDDLVNRKYYLTGGVGSGETSEGFGPDYSLRNNSYCESCSGCGELFFQYSRLLSDRNAKFADLYEQTLYNAILGDIDMDGTHFTYTNALDERGKRTVWHNCPCCVGNIPRTLLDLPTWMYSKDASNLYVNLFSGSTVNVGSVGGTNVQIVQETDYPWNGAVAITVNPAEEKIFSVRVRVPDRDVSTLYTASPMANGIESISINGEVMTPAIENGYAVITRSWKAGDKIALSLPMVIQRVKAIDKVAADRGRVALRYGPLVYNIENVDGDLTRMLPPDAKLASEWRGDFLHGVRVITGTFADGSPLLAIPNYARNNRGDQTTESIVWMREQQNRQANAVGGADQLNMADLMR